MISYKKNISVKDYNDLRASVGWKVLDEKQASAGLENSCFVTAAYDGEEPVGSARVVGDNGYMFLIADVMVRPDHQGINGLSARPIKMYLMIWLIFLLFLFLFVDQ